MKCPYCGSEHTQVFYTAMMPNILSACPEATLEKVRIFPLEARVCTDCLLGFNSTPLSDEELTDIYDNYLYITPSEGIGTSKYVGMVRDLKQFFQQDDVLVEIGCSEGYLLGQLLEEGYTHLIGIEPGPQAASAQGLGVEIRKEYFDAHTFQGKLVDGFYLMHVFEHFPDPFMILKAMKSQLKPSGKIIIEVPDFDGFHHQHLFYYNTHFMKRLCDDNGLKIIHCTIDMGAMRVVLAHAENEQYAAVELTDEPASVLERASVRHGKFQDLLGRLKTFLADNEGKQIYWWGAGSTSVIFMNQIQDELESGLQLYVIDGDRNKWGYYIPYLGVEIKPYTSVANEELDCLIIASSFYNEIQHTLAQHNISAQKTLVLV